MSKNGQEVLIKSFTAEKGYISTETERSSPCARRAVQKDSDLTSSPLRVRVHNVGLYNMFHTLRGCVENEDGNNSHNDRLP